MIYKVIRVRYGEEQEYLDKGYEPFAVTTEDTSYMFTDSSTGRREMKPQSTDYIYLRKQVVLTTGGR